MYNVVVQATNIIKKGDFMAIKTNSLSHTRWLCKYHISSYISVSSFMGYLKGKGALMIKLLKNHIFNKIHRPNIIY